MSGRFVRSAGVVAAAIGVVLLVLAVAAVLVVRSGTANEWLRARLAERLGPRVRFATAQVVWSPEPSLVLTGVGLVPAPDDADPPQVSAERLACTPQLGPLLHGDVLLDEVQVDGLRVAASVHAAPRAGGDPVAETLAWIRANALPGPLPQVRVHQGDIDVRLDTSATAPPTAEARTLRVHLVDAVLRPDGAGAQLELSATLQPNGSVTARLSLDSLAAADTSPLTISVDAAQLDAAALREWLPAELAGVGARGALRIAAQAERQGAGPFGGTVALELADGGLDWAEWHADSPLRISAHPTWNNGVVTVTNGTLDAAHAGGAAGTAQTLAASFEYENGALRITRAEFEALGGAWSGGGRVAVTTPLSIDATLSGKAVDCAALRTTLEAYAGDATLPSCDGELQLSLTGSGLPAAEWNAVVNLATAGRVLWSDGRADGPIAVTAELIGEGTRVRSASGTANAQRVAISSLTAQPVSVSYEYEDGAVRVAPLRTGLFGGTWTYTGSVPLGRTRWDGELSATGVDAAALSTALGGGLAAAAPRGTVDASAHLSGTGTTAVTAAATARLGSPMLLLDSGLRIDPPAQIGGTVQYGNGRVRLSDGQLRAQRIQYGPMVAGAAAVRFSADSGGTLQIGAAEATAFAGHWHASGTATLGSDVQWSGNVHVKHVDCNALVKAADALDDDDWPRCPGAVADITGQVHRDAAGTVGGSATVGLNSGAFHWEELEIDAPAHASGTFTARQGNVSFSGVSADAARAKYGPLIGTEASGQLRYAHATDRLTFDDLRFRSCGGQVTHSGWFTMAEGGRFNGQLTADHIAPHALASMLDETELDIPFAQLDLEAQFDGTATARWKEDLDMVGSVLLRDGTLPAAAILRPIFNALVGERSMRAVGDQPTRVAHVSDSFTLRGGVFDTSDLSLLSNDYSVTGVGRIDMDGSLDLQTRIQLTSSGMQKMFFFASLPLPTGALPPLPPIPAGVKGTLNDPIIRPNVSALPVSTARWFLDAVIHTPGSMAGAIYEPLRRAWNGMFGGN